MRFVNSILTISLGRPRTSYQSSAPQTRRAISARSCRDLADALKQAGSVPDYFIFGMAPSSGMLSKHERSLVLEAMSHGMNIVNGLHEFLNGDPVFAAACIASNVEILDVRKPRAKKDLQMFSGRIAEVTSPVIAGMCECSR